MTEQRIPKVGEEWTHTCCGIVTVKAVTPSGSSFIVTYQWNNSGGICGARYLDKFLDYFTPPKAEPPKGLADQERWATIREDGELAAIDRLAHRRHSHLQELQPHRHRAPRARPRQLRRDHAVISNLKHQIGDDGKCSGCGSGHNWELAKYGFCDCKNPHCHRPHRKTS